MDVNEFAKRGFMIFLWLISLMILASILWPCDANAADYAIVSFNSPEHLAALQDSVVGVRDTVNEVHCYYLDGDSSATHYWDVPTCRRLVGVTVTKFPKKLEGAKCIPCPVKPGEAIIFYEPFKEEQ